MRKLGFLVLVTLIFLAGCSRNNIPEADVQTGIQTVAVTPSLEPVSPIVSEKGKIVELSMASLRSGFALTESNHILKTVDGGVTWSEFYTIKAVDIRTGICPIIYSTDENTLYIVTHYNGTTNFLATTDSGKTWSSTIIHSELSWAKDDIGGYEMNFINKNCGYIMIEATPGAGQVLKALYKTTDAGKNWVMITGDEGGQDNIQGIKPVGIGGYPSGMAFSSPKEGWTFCSCYATYGIWLYKTNNGGKTWSMLDIPELPPEFSKWDETDLFLGASAPSFYGSKHKDGKMIMLFKTYIPQTKESEYIYSLSDNGTWVLEGKCNSIISNYKFVDDNHGIGLDDKGSICTTEDGGLTWNRVIGQTEATLPSPTVMPTNIPAILSDFNKDLISWLKSTTKIPVNLPGEWNPIKKEEQHYYIEASGDADSYNINVYKTKVSVSFNDKQDLLDKNGPISEADFVGALSGTKYDAADFLFEIPKDAESFDLTSQIKAYEKEDGCSVWWTENGWNFSYTGSIDKQTLKKFASAWSDSDIQVSKTGNVKIVGGNRFTFYYTWEKDGYQYGFTTHETNYEKAVKVLNSFINIDQIVNKD